MVSMYGLCNGQNRDAPIIESTIESSPLFAYRYSCLIALGSHKCVIRKIDHIVFYWFENFILIIGISVKYHIK